MNEKDLEQSLSVVTDSLVKEAMTYSFMAGGKRIRPRMLLAVLEGYGVEEEIGLPFAQSLEMIHTSSLIHDDLPAMDNDDLRRGKPTCHKAFDEATAILAGDGLLLQAFENAASTKADPEKVVRCMYELARAAGSSGMVYGQCLDMDTNEKDWEALKKTHHFKTGCLFAVPLKIGAILSNQDEETIQSFEQLGYDLGLAFQIQDDILDVTMTSEQLGKSNSDQRNEKETSVVLLGIEESTRIMNELYEKCMKTIQNFRGFDGNALMNLLKGVITRNQ